MPVPNQNLGASHHAQALPVPLLLAAIVAALAIPSDATEPPEVNFQAVADAKAKIFLNDLSSRRRGTRLFRNPQHLQNGVQENFVNTTKGNLTFLVRDLVAVAPMPLVLGRVYDSAYQEAGGDFGPGWRLTVAEKIDVNDRELAYTDAANVVYRFKAAGSRLVPLTPAFPGTGTVETDGTITLRSKDLTRRFAPSGGGYRLSDVASDVGRATLSYRGGRLDAISSGAAEVRLLRRSDGRLVAIRDHLGRAVRYGYDSKGTLATVADLAGETWRLGYRALGPGESVLASIADPRGHVVLEAAFEDGKTSFVRVLAVKTSFHYEGHTTRVVDALGRTTTFYHLASGATDGVTDPTGSHTQLIFNGRGQPTVVQRNGVDVGRLEYDNSGRLSSLVSDAREIEFAYGAHGLVRVTGDAADATYAYDAQGRVTAAADGAGQRTYAYGEGGALAAVTLDGVTTELRTDANGATTEARRDGEPVIVYRHRADGRVAGIDYANSASVRYRYDKRGFRTQADYGQDVTSQLRYDAAGNLVRYELRSPDATVAQDYQIGRDNQVLGIRNTGLGNSPPVAFRYDEAGRLLTVDAGVRSAAIEHDGLDRVSSVSLDGEPLLAYRYDPLDLGAIARADRLTADVAVAPGTSQVFGTLDSIVYTRPRPMEHGAVGYVPALKAFAPRWDHLVPDAVLRSSLARRAMPTGRAPPNVAPFGYDKPSNSLFIPAEYRAINCRVCSSSIQSTTFTASGNARVGQAVQFSASVTGTCTETGLGFYGSPAWQHSMDFGDGATTSAASFTGAVVASHVYRNAGTFTASNRIACGCETLVNLIRNLLSVRVEPAELAPPGDCEKPWYDFLAGEVRQLCKSPPPSKCARTDSCNLLRIKRQRFVACERARITINTQCFRGGNAGHIEQVEAVGNAIKNCNKWIRLSCR